MPGMHGLLKVNDSYLQARIYARAPGARAQGGKFSGTAYLKNQD